MKPGSVDVDSGNVSFVNFFIVQRDGSAVLRPIKKPAGAGFFLILFRGLLACFRGGS